MVIYSIKCLGYINGADVSCIPTFNHVVNDQSSCTNCIATSTSFLKPKLAIGGYKKDLNLLTIQCSKTFDTIGLMAMPVKSSQVYCNIP